MHFGLHRTNKTVPSKELTTVRGLLHGYRLFSNEVVKIIFIKVMKISRKMNSLVMRVLYDGTPLKLF